MTYGAKWGPKSERPCKYVYGELIPLTDEQMEEREAIRNAPTGFLRGGERNSHYRLTKEEAGKIALQIGDCAPPEDEAARRRLYRERGLRDQERGERAYDVKEIIKEWTKGGSQGPCPVPPYVPPPKKKESFLELRDRYRREGRLRG